MWSTRRDILAFLLGTPFAAGCKRRYASPRFRGRFVDNFEDGHLLRDRGALLSRPLQKTRRIDTLILGGGVAGLSSAYHLKKSDPQRDILLLEMGEDLGGTSASGESGVTRFPWGAHYLPRTAGAKSRSLRLLGGKRSPNARRKSAAISGADVGCRAKRARVFGGAWHPGLFPHGLARSADELELRRFTQVVDGWSAAVGEKNRRPSRSRFLLRHLTRRISMRCPSKNGGERTNSPHPASLVY